MSKLTWIIAMVFFIHGIGHIMCLLPALGMNVSPTWNSHSWLLSDLMGQRATNILAVIIWLTTVIGFLLAALALLGWGVPHEWWRPLAVVSAVMSLIGIILFWNAFASWFNKAGAIAVDLAVLIGLLVMHWPVEQQLAINS
jgi:hypothetical protein